MAEGYETICHDIKFTEKSVYVTATATQDSLFGYRAEITPDTTGCNKVLAIIPLWARRKWNAVQSGVLSYDSYNNKLICDANMNSELTLVYMVVYLD